MEDFGNKNPLGPSFNETDARSCTTDKDRSQFSHLADSQSYIRKLESKLSKVKGCTKELNSKEMISVMQNARDDHMSRMISLSSNNLSHLPDNWDEMVPASYLERKLFPEKIGVTQEELQNLLASDVLANIFTEATSESTVER